MKYILIAATLLLMGCEPGQYTGNNGIQYHYHTRAPQAVYTPIQIPQQQVIQYQPLQLQPLIPYNPPTTINIYRY